MKIKLFFFVWFIIVSSGFNYFAYEIQQFNIGTRVLLNKGKLQGREFTESGLPLSFSPKIGAFQSPFYVAHYAVMYSDKIKTDNTKLFWRYDPSLGLWDYPPKYHSREDSLTKFINSVDWLVENISFDDNGNAHYFYNFDWKYKGYPNGGLRAPWYSGLADAYAIIPLLRAYDFTGDGKYLDTAKLLYSSVTTNVARGGSLTSLNDYIWIEEYVDPQIEDKSKLAFVFNGMVYSTYAVAAYEEYAGEVKYADKLLDSVLKNIKDFDSNGWSKYDLLNNNANIKYHRVHAAILADLIENNKNKLRGSDYKYLLGLSEAWNSTSNNAGFFYLIYGPKSFGYYHFVILFLFIALMPVLVFFWWSRRCAKRKV